MKHLLIMAILSLVLGPVRAFHVNPNAVPGPEPGVPQSFTEEQLAQQQADLVLEPAPVIDQSGESTEPPDLPEGASDGLQLGVREPGSPSDSRIHGEQVLRRVDKDFKQSGGRFLSAAAGFAIFCCLGFGSVAYLRYWAEKKLPDPTNHRGARHR